ncbi:MAG: hypothetical protein JWQ78_595 [Sediminibacterium sp.]|nr:hypothetical protein [Sediminibacterium sp.]
MWQNEIDLPTCFTAGITKLFLSQPILLNGKLFSLFLCVCLEDPNYKPQTTNPKPEPWL